MDGRVALVTGVSRRAGIGFAIARRLAADGVRVFAHHHVPHDADRDWGADPAGIDAVIDAICGEPPHAGFDLAQPDTPAALLDAARAAFGHVDILVCNHASSGPDGPLADVTAEMLDAPLGGQHARLAAARPGVRRATTTARPGGRIVLMTSGQNLGPMPGDRLRVVQGRARGDHALDRRRARRPRHHRQLREPRSRPTRAGRTPELTAAVAAQMPAGRWGEPDDAARLIAWLVSEDGPLDHRPGAQQRGRIQTLSVSPLPIYTGTKCLMRH